MAGQSSCSLCSIMAMPKIEAVLDFGGSWKVYSPSSISKFPHNRCGFDPHYSFPLPQPRHPYVLKEKESHN